MKTTIFFLAIFAAVIMTGCEKQAVIDGTYQTVSYQNNGQTIDGVSIQLTLYDGQFTYDGNEIADHATGTYEFTENTFSIDWGNVVSVWQYTFDGETLVLYNDFERWELRK